MGLEGQIDPYTPWHLESSLSWTDGRTRVFEGRYATSVHWSDDTALIATIRCGLSSLWCVEYQSSMHIGRYGICSGARMSRKYLADCLAPLMLGD